MKKISNFTKQEIYLEGFGTIEISESTWNGIWKIDLFPRGFENDPEKLLIEVKLNANSDKYFASINAAKKALEGLDGC